MGEVRLRTLRCCNSHVGDTDEAVLRSSVAAILKHMALYGLSRCGEALAQDNRLECHGETCDGLVVEVVVYPVMGGYNAEMKFDGRWFGEWLVERDRVLRVRELPEVIGWAVESLLAQRFSGGI
jgi:hypothetical protein